jgi:hypothetical protein
MIQLTSGREEEFVSIYVETNRYLPASNLVSLWDEVF